MKIKIPDGTELEFETGEFLHFQIKTAENLRDFINVLGKGPDKIGFEPKKLKEKKSEDTNIG